MLCLQVDQAVADVEVCPVPTPSSGVPFPVMNKVCDLSSCCNVTSLGLNSFRSSWTYNMHDIQCELTDVAGGQSAVS